MRKRRVLLVAMVLTIAYSLSGQEPPKYIIEFASNKAVSLSIAVFVWQDLRDKGLKLIYYDQVNGVKPLQVHKVKRELKHEAKYFINQHKENYGRKKLL